MIDHDPSRRPEPRPWLFREPSVPHYYGDVVRSLMLVAAALILVGAPFYAGDLAAQLPILVAAVFILVFLAALTSPRNRAVLIADAVVTGFGMGIFEAIALSSYASSPILAFALLQAIALLFLFAFYFSGKTIRALVMEHPSTEMDEDEQPYLDPSPNEDDEAPDEEEDTEYERRRRQAHPYQLPEDRSDD